MKEEQNFPQDNAVENLSRKIAEDLKKLLSEILKHQKIPSALDESGYSVFPEMSISSVLNLPAAEIGKKLRAGMFSSINESVQMNSVFMHGRVFCYLCQSLKCEHSMPADSRCVFLKYSSSGKPEWAEFLVYLAERKIKNLDELFIPDPRIITVMDDSEMLNSEAKEIINFNADAPGVLGQVVAGYFYSNIRQSNSNKNNTYEIRYGSSQKIAVTIQVAVTGKRPRLKFNLISGAEMSNQSCQTEDHNLSMTLHNILRKADTRIYQAQRQMRKWKKDDPANLLIAKNLLLPVKNGIEKAFSMKPVRSEHAEQRRIEGRSLVGLAVEELLHAPLQSVLVDSRYNNLVILGSRNHVHIFSFQGKHISSFTGIPRNIERKIRLNIWKPLKEQWILEELKKNVKMK